MSQLVSGYFKLKIPAHRLIESSSIEMLHRAKENKKHHDGGKQEDVGGFGWFRFGFATAYR